MSDPELVSLDPPAELAMPIGEAMFSQRAIRRLDPDRPITDAQIKIIIDAGSKAPSGGNVQPARFLVVRSREKIAALGKLYHEAWWAKRRDELGWKGWEDIPEDSVYRFAARLADEMERAPLIVLAFTLAKMPSGSSLYPSVQNMLLAARALGIGSVLTTLHPQVMERVYERFAVPPDMVFHCCLPFGYPRGRFGPTRRFPTAHTTHWDSWDNAPPW